MDRAARSDLGPLATVDMRLLLLPLPGATDWCTIVEVRLGDAPGFRRRIVDNRGDGRGICDCDIDLPGTKSCAEVGDTMTQSPPWLVCLLLADRVSCGFSSCVVSSPVG